MTGKAGQPRYAELPTRNGMPCSWGLWGEQDVLGTLNRLTPQRAVAAAAEVRRGAVFPLDLPLDAPQPALFGRDELVHRITEEAGFGGVERFQDDVLDHFNTQSSSQWDGFRHVGGRGLGYYNGLPDTEHGVGHWSAHGIVARAVLADVGRWRESAGRPMRLGESDGIGLDELLECLRAQASPVEPGDVLLIRTGWPRWWQAQPLGFREPRTHGPFDFPGLTPDERVAEWLWDQGIAAVASDTPALELGPAAGVLTDYDAPTESDTPEAVQRELSARTNLHVRLLVLLGMPIGELFDLDALADDCAADGRYTALLTSAPLNLAQGIGSPPNALAVK